MDITFRCMSAAEAWNFIERRYSSFHSQLKHFGYDYKMFLPQNSAMCEMFEKEILTPEEIKKYHDIFINQIYDEKELHKLDEIIENSAIPALKKGVKALGFMKKNGIKFPEKVEILNTYGVGGSYNLGDSQIILRMTELKRENTVGLLQHEFVHLLIEESVIQKYNVPQDLKERVVDIICLEYFNKPVQKSFEDSFANQYITKAAIGSDFSGAIQKMMSDFEKMQSHEVFVKSK